MEKAQRYTLKELQDTARTFEAVRRQSRYMAIPEASVNHISTKPSQKKDKGKAAHKMANATCYRCGKQGHFARNPSCPARNKTCNKCRKTGHFAVVCKTKKVSLVEDYDEYAFSVNGKDQFEKIQVSIGGQNVQMIVDSGASVNIIDRQLWEKLKEKKIKCSSQQSQRKLFAYGSTKLLIVLGSFTTQYLGRSTALYLGVLQIGANVMHVRDTSQIATKYKEVFEGIGKLKDYQL